ncbi:MAG: secondary thiamine-phosphate synthase enzyme YjbQ [Candidatus Kariarchaeaceae archaeon]|jgi:secondary thiamine-phosphate synthase enzyme
MTVIHSEINLPRTHENDMIDITSELERIVRDSKVRDGIVNVFNAGSTGAVITLEYEPGLIKDIPEFLEKIIPKSGEYHHEKTWHDGNGHSHVKASLLGPSLTIPIRKGLVHGTWQQIAFLELDVKTRNRQLVVTVIGE